MHHELSMQCWRSWPVCHPAVAACLPSPLTMLRNKLYYNVKPLIPQFVRLAIRRRMARRKCRQMAARWPILPGSERPPAGWPGWPGAKKFSLVLTHDVEGPSGLAKVVGLMELEEKLGFRSAFNFIPEGAYETPPRLRTCLRERGFEVGVHDLHHDGKLYESREVFEVCAKKINEYLRAWKAAGYRSGMMFHNLEWQHALKMEYDASTFDTDPFEPQPQGVGTIFPFWVERPGAGPEGELDPPYALALAGGAGAEGKLCVYTPAKTLSSEAGYVELPYTLAQDCTLFLVLQEQTIATWVRKLDWIAEHGGMALLNVHPDYVQFPGERPSPHKFPVERYVEFLQYVRGHYAEQYWQALPREVAGFVRQGRQAGRSFRRSSHIALVAYSHYATDGRIKRYAEALAERGDRVEMLSTRESLDEPQHFSDRGVQVHQIFDRLDDNQTKPMDYLIPIVRFLVRARRWLNEAGKCDPLEVIHVHNVPDFLVFAATKARHQGAKVILDIHDLVPEFFGSKFGGRKRGLTIAALRWMEWLSARQADHVIVSNDLWLGTYALRTGSMHKASVFVNYVDSTIFRPDPAAQPNGKPIIIFPGGLQWHQGVDLAIRAFAEVSAQMPAAEFHIYGWGNMKGELIKLAKELNLEQKVRFFEPVSIDEIAKIIPQATLAVVPKRADGFGNEAYSTKIMEMMAVGVPVVAAATKIDRYYFNESLLKFFEPGNPKAMAEAMVAVLTDEKLRSELVKNALAHAAQNSWDIHKYRYLRLVDDLVVPAPN